MPLTQSMYVPGRIADSGKVLIDIGTGYYVEKSLPKAKEYLDRRVRHFAGKLLMTRAPPCRCD